MRYVILTAVLFGAFANMTFVLNSDMPSVAQFGVVAYMIGACLACWQEMTP